MIYNMLYNNIEKMNIYKQYMKWREPTFHHSAILGRWETTSELCRLQSEPVNKLATQYVKQV